MLNDNPKKNRVCAAMVAAVVLCGATTARADVVLDWNAIMLATVTGNPFMSARYAAITQLAVFEAVNAITGEYEPYLGTIPAPAGASAEAAAATAAHDVLVFYFPGKAVALDASLAASLGAIPDGTAKTDGIDVGEAAAAAMIALRTGDGSAVPAFYTPTSTDAGQWQATPSCGAAAVGTNYHWQFVTPFALPNLQDFRAATPPLLTSGAYAKAYNEVKTVGAIDSVARSQDRTDVARFYAGGLSPVGWANIAAQQIASVRPESLSENARALALINMAISDAAVSVFDAKYHYTTWRPETAIHGADADGNPKTDPDVAFTPLIVAPCFPSYPSAHGTLSSAAAEVLQRLYGASGHDLTFSAASVPGVVLHYTTFKAIIADISDARVYGGIHFRFDQDGGERQGQRIGQYIFKHSLRPILP
jgi:membrane-associated phospholipid phosphatase